MAMDPKVKQAWIDALRSGKYKQARKRLYRQETKGYCCLGVLCDIAKPEGWDGIGIEINEPGEAVYYDFQKLPTVTRVSFGIPEKVCADLMGMNDKGKTFKTIAKHIEREL